VPIPILKQRDVLIACLQEAPTDQDLVQLSEDLAGRIGSLRSRGVVIDVSALDVMDSFATRTLRSIAQAIRLRGAEMIIVGIQPDVAFTMIQLGLTLDGIPTALDLEEGLEQLAQRTVKGAHRGP
jgi:rsbT antagonist protein RsbS